MTVFESSDEDLCSPNSYYNSFEEMYELSLEDLEFMLEQERPYAVARLPSPQDRQVAAMATRMAMQASMELALRRDGTAGTTAAADSRAAGATTVAAYAGVAATGGEAPAAAIDLFA